MKNHLRGQAKKREAKRTIELRALTRMIGKNDRTRRKISSRRAAVRFLQLIGGPDSVDRANDYYSRRLGY